MSIAAPFDLDDDSRRSLEFDELLTWVASFARTDPGRLRVAALGPSAELDRVRADLDAVEETRTCIAEGGRLVAGSLPDPEPALGALKVEGSFLDGLSLRQLASVLMAVWQLRQQLTRLERDDHPHLWRLGETLPDLHEEAADILHCTEPDGRINDAASPELRRIRAASASIGERLRRMLESYFRDPHAAMVVQDDFITQRNGRFVIPVRTDTPRPVRGIVHAASSSGATHFVEPMETVELNNDLVRLAEEEKEEQERVLLGWSESLRYRWDDLAGAIEGLAEVDSLQARALFAESIGAIRPEVRESGALVFRSVRHPLLDRRLRGEGSSCVPLSLGLDPSDQVLVLSGPNTGGKTVAIKTFGVAVLMAQSGIPVAAAEARLPIYRQLRSDIGDHQSIEADLSTYSARIRTVVGCLRDATPPALFLFDEIGSGTEPVEGAALAQSILEALQRPGMTTVATTHQGALKAWAFTTEGAVSAAMEFDAESLRPTFSILMGAAGVSAGLDIAERLGLDPAIVAGARQRMGEGNVQSETYLARLRDLTADLARRREEAARLESELIEERRRLQSRAE
jgi:DNA mismatch repair protein MutS2